jgi:hypothetical protein
VLLGQGYRTPRGAVTGAYGGGGVVMVSKIKLKNLEETCYNTTSPTTNVN